MSTVTSDRTVDAALLDSLFDDLAAATEFKPTEFPGEITIDSFGPDKFDETALASWHLAVRPLSFTLKSATGAFHGYEKIKLNKDGKISENSAAGRVIKAIREGLGPDSDGKPLKPGKGQLVGRYGMFVMETLEFGKDKRKDNPDGTPNPKFGQTIKAGRPSVMMTRALTPDEIAKYVHGVVAEQAGSFSTDDLEAALAVMEGKKPSIYQRGLMRNDELSQEIKTAILNGDMAKALVAEGLAVEEDGVLVRTEGE